MSKSPYLVDVHELAQQLQGETIPAQSAKPSDKPVVIDTRFSLAEPELGRTQYEASHIPGAYYLDLNQDLAGPVQRHGGRHPLPDWAKFVAKLNALGIYSQPPNGPTPVVIYDDSRFAFAARLWWMLRYLGHEQVAILNGGIKAWQAAGLPLSTKTPKPVVGDFRSVPQAGWIVDIEAVRRQQASGMGILVDARSPERFRGEVEPIDPIAGSIPGAANAFWQQITTESGHLRDTDVLSSQWITLRGENSAKPEGEIIAYCGSGVTACVNLFGWVMAGQPMHKLYPGGWSDWCSYLEPAPDAPPLRSY
jgi:thiosulfate/3-mercaptopyruvate sulfurtransferase